MDISPKVERKGKEVYYLMSKSKITKVVLSLALALVLVGGSVAYFNTGVRTDGSLTDQAAVRDAGIPADGIVYIEPEMVSLAGALSGNADSQAAAKAAFDLVNTKRQEAGLTALAWDNGLEQASAVRAVEASQSFSHTRPDGSDWWTVNSNLMYAENLAKGYTTGDSAVTAWMNSPTHKANIMDSELRTCAIAIHVSDGGWYWAQEFGY